MIFKRIYFFFFTYLAAAYFSGTLLVLWLSKNGFGFSDLIVYYLLTFFFAFIGLFFLPQKNMNVRKTIFLGILFNICYVLLLVKIFHPIQILLSTIVSGLNIVYFWTPYNIMYFKYSSEEKRGLNSGIYFLVTPLVGITLQPLAGVVAEKFGFETMFFIGFLMYLIPIFLIRYLPKFEWSLNLRKEISQLKFNWSTVFQGISSRLNYSVVPIFTLFFIKSPKEFGSFFGYLALMTAFASVINGYISDRLKNRKFFFYLFSILAVLSFIPLSFATDNYSWVVFAGITSLCISLVNPFWMAFNLDYYKDKGVEKAMLFREFFLNLGYVFELLLIFFIFYFTHSTKTSLITVSVLTLLLPLISYLQGAYRIKNA